MKRSPVSVPRWFWTFWKSSSMRLKLPRSRRAVRKRKNSEGREPQRCPDGWTNPYENHGKSGRKSGKFMVNGGL